MHAVSSEDRPASPAKAEGFLPLLSLVYSQGAWFLWRLSPWRLTLILLFSSGCLPWTPQNFLSQKGTPKQVWTRKGGWDIKEASEHKPQPKSVLRHIIRTIESHQMVDIFYLISASCQEGWEGKLYHASYFTNDETPIYLFVQSASQQTFIKHLFNSWYSAALWESGKKNQRKIFLPWIDHSWPHSSLFPERQMSVLTNEDQCFGSSVKN